MSRMMAQSRARAVSLSSLRDLTGLSIGQGDHSLIATLGAGIGTGGTSNNSIDGLTKSSTMLDSLSVMYATERQGSC
jgi:hypothetical protein